MPLQTKHELLTQFNNPKEGSNPHRDLNYSIEKLLNLQLGNFQKRYGTPLTEGEKVDSKNQLSIYQDTFDWDTKWDVSVEWDCLPSTATSTHTCANEEEFREVLKGRKEIDEPSYDDCRYELNYDFDRVVRREAEVSISNLRLKGQPDARSKVLGSLGEIKND